jgi:hypothetical protein
MFLPLEDGELPILLLLLTPVVKPQDRFIHDTGEEEYLVNLSSLGTLPSSSCRATAIWAFRSFFFCSVLAILYQ